MAGYANRTIHLPFPELTEEGAAETIHVIIRNPKTMPAHALSRRDITEDELKANPEAAFFASYEIIARLIVAWHVYDATSADEDQPRLGLPATEALVAKLPREIVEAISEKVMGAQAPGAGA